MSALSIGEEETGGAVVLEPSGRLDSVTAKSFETTLIGKIEAGARKVVLDLGRLDYISSAGLRVVLIAAKRLKSVGGALVLCTLNPSVREVFEISGFASILEIHPDRDAALAG
jgi:anti-anti-sigma factor